MIATVILSSLVLATVNCQLAFTWLNNQHFQCAQNKRNYHEAIQHQYICLSSQIWTCILDVNVYARSSIITLDYFCGFIDGRNALQPHTIWNIDLRPNIHIHFHNFFLSNNYWYCDFEHLEIFSNSKRSRFCGSRLSWVYDVSDTNSKIILVTSPFGVENYQLTLQYTIMEHMFH